ncbi:hypothetical protein GCM10009528_10540 [Kineococcus aurantiacus]
MAGWARSQLGRGSRTVLYGLVWKVAPSPVEAPVGEVVMGPDARETGARHASVELLLAPDGAGGHTRPARAAARCERRLTCSLAKAWCRCEPTVRCER